MTRNWGGKGMELVLICWSCGKEHKGIPVDKPYKCECGGYVVSPSGKTKGKWIIDESAVYGNDCPSGKCEM